MIETSLPEVSGTSQSTFATLVARFMRAVRMLFVERSRPADYIKGYRPERHYMRGIGPKCLLKQSNREQA